MANQRRQPASTRLAWVRAALHWIANNVLQSIVPVRTCARILPPLSVWVAAGCLNMVLSLQYACADPSGRVPSPQQVAPGVYAVIGASAEPTLQNHGAVGNQGIIIGTTGVILVDTGTSARYATELIATVRRLTDKPIVLAIDTHQHPAFIFGNGALASQGVPILAHQEVADLIGQRCETCLKNLNVLLGTQEMAGTLVTVPTRLITQATSMTVAGRILDIVYFGHSSSPGAIGVLDRASGVLFAGGLVSIDRVPETKDARIDAWLAALSQLQTGTVRILVPGEGPVSSPLRMQEMAAYLIALQQSVTRTFTRGISLGDAGADAALPAFSHLPLYHPQHNKNVEQLYLALERTALSGP